MDEKGNELVQHLLQHAAHLQRMQQDGQLMNDDHGDDDDHEHDDHAVATAKITAMCVLFVASVICGCFPFLLNRWFRWTETHASVRSATVVKGLLYFGGGVLLCTTFLHLVPEVSHNIESLQECHLLPELSFHLPHLLMCAGFFAMYLVEEIVHTYLRKYRKSIDSTQKAFERGHSVRNSTLVRGKPAVSNGKSNGLSKEELIQDDIEYQKSEGKAVTPTAPSQIQLESDHHHHDVGHSHSVPITEDGIVSALRGLLIVLALSLHELFEGLAVGLESEPERVWYMFGAVSAHKLVLAFCVGVELIVNRTKMWLAIVYVVTFAVVSPLGIGIGIIVSSEDNMASAIPAAILQGLASGTLLYVVFFEILSKDRSGLINYAAFIFGFLLMFGIQFATTGSHGHSHAHCEHSHGEEDTRSHTHGAHDTEHVSFVASNDKNLKLIKETAEELAHALATKIK